MCFALLAHLAGRLRIRQVPTGFSSLTNSKRTYIVLSSSTSWTSQGAARTTTTAITNSSLMNGNGSTE